MKNGTFAQKITHIKFIKYVLQIILLSFFLPQNTIANEAAKCTYSDETKAFTNFNGHQAFIIFGKHGIPSEILSFFDLEKSFQKSDVVKLIKRHKHNLELNPNYKLAVDIFKNIDPDWIGIEGTDTPEDPWQPEKVSIIKNRELDFKKLGLTDEEVFRALLILYDPVEIAAFKLSLSATIPIVGIDNKRNPEIKKITEKEKKLFQEALNQWGLVIESTPEWIWKSWRNLTLNNDSEKIAARLAQALNSSKGKNLNPKSQKSINGFIEFLKNYSETKKSLDLLESEELKLRDEGMADEIFLRLTAANGIVHIGKAHKDGILEHLIIKCREQLYRSQQSPAPQLPSESETATQ